MGRRPAWRYAPSTRAATRSSRPSSKGLGLTDHQVAPAWQSLRRGNLMAAAVLHAMAIAAADPALRPRHRRPRPARRIRAGLRHVGGRLAVPRPVRQAGRSAGQLGTTPGPAVPECAAGDCRHLLRRLIVRSMTRRDPDFTFLAGPAAMSAQTLAALSRPAATRLRRPGFPRRLPPRRDDGRRADAHPGPDPPDGRRGCARAGSRRPRPGPPGRNPRPEPGLRPVRPGRWAAGCGNWRPRRRPGRAVAAGRRPRRGGTAYLDEHPADRAAHRGPLRDPLRDRNDLARIGPAARARGVLTLADCVSTLGGMPLQAGDWQLDVVVSAPHKCLGGPSGHVAGLGQRPGLGGDRVEPGRAPLLLPVPAGLARTLARQGPVPLHAVRRCPARPWPPPASRPWMRAWTPASPGTPPPPAPAAPARPRWAWRCGRPARRHRGLRHGHRRPRRARPRGRPPADAGPVRGGHLPGLRRREPGADRPHGPDRVRPVPGHRADGARPGAGRPRRRRGHRGRDRGRPGLGLRRRSDRRHADACAAVAGFGCRGFPAPGAAGHRASHDRPADTRDHHRQRAEVTAAGPPARGRRRRRPPTAAAVEHGLADATGAAVAWQRRNGVDVVCDGEVDRRSFLDARRLGFDGPPCRSRSPTWPTPATGSGRPALPGLPRRGAGTVQHPRDHLRPGAGRRADHPVQGRAGRPGRRPARRGLPGRPLTRRGHPGRQQLLPRCRGLPGRGRGRAGSTNTARSPPRA